MPLEKQVAQILTRRQLTLAVAESCSGGLLSHRLTNIPGSSQFFLLGLVTYANSAKMKLLGVPPSLLGKQGTVSLSVAKKMAQGIRRILRTDLGVAVTGIAGPGGSTPAKPVGLTFIAISSSSRTVCSRFQFRGSRQTIKRLSAESAMTMILDFLKNQ